VAPEVMTELGSASSPSTMSPMGKHQRRLRFPHPRSLARKVIQVKADIGSPTTATPTGPSGSTKKRVLTAIIPLHSRPLHEREEPAQVRFRRRDDHEQHGPRSGPPKMDLALVRTKVGDKYVLDKMLELGTNLAASGPAHHLSRRMPTGDGILTSLRCSKFWREGFGLVRLTRGMVEFPSFC